MTTAPRDRLERWLPWLLFGGALLLRLYRLSANPLWLDELYGAQLGRLGLTAIIQNSWYEPTPPLYHLLVWLGSGLASARAEWAYRWIAVLTGAVTVPLVYTLARRWAGRWPAAGAALALLVSPTHLYYSQEARSYGAAACVAALSAWLLLTDRLKPPARWGWWALVSAAGLLLNYAYVMIAGMQLLFALWRARRERGALPAGLSVGALLVAVVALAAHTLPGAVGSVSGDTVTLWRTVQSLTAGELPRYGLFADHTWLAAALAVFFLLGVLYLTRRAGQGWALYAPAQVLLPLGAFFLVLRPFAGVEMQLYQTRQFLVLLPAALVTAAAGAQQLADWLRRLAAPRWLVLGLGLMLALVVVGFSAPGLGRYWSITKSPEGQVARFVRDHGVAGTAVISLHASLDAAFDFYAPGAARYFTKQLRTPAGVIYGDSLSVQVRDWPLMPRPYTAADISSYARRWVAWQVGVSDALVAELTAGCTLVAGGSATFAPFAVTLVENCPPLE
jgi:4-amino-4-deoxy-L-arabinose transferase-like glycosyltransferase